MLGLLSHSDAKFRECWFIDSGELFVREKKKQNNMKVSYRKHIAC